MKYRLAAAVLLLGNGMVIACAQAQSEPDGFPDPGETLVDGEFRVKTREFGLDRRVEMYQWRANDGRYERVWHGARIESETFAAGHENPPKLPLENQRWWAEKPTLDGKPLDPAVLRTLGEWRVLHPNFSRLPANLSAAFQPEGEGLGSAENPLEPQIGDLRVSWRELVLPPLAGKIQLRDGVWRLINDPAAGAPDPANVPKTPQPGKAQRLWPYFGAGLLLIIAMVVAHRRRAARKAHSAS
ncbi:MAG TPA: TMEM43 family protein [Lysobacter sp.]|nr:TMEM43 family protein [Lysobacter sp.]